MLRRPCGGTPLLAHLATNLRRLGAEVALDEETGSAWVTARAGEDHASYRTSARMVAAGRSPAQSTR
jgi:hypothetical protein